MKFVATIVLILFSVLVSFSQKEDYIWIFGYNSELPEGNETYIIDFNNGSSPDSIRGLSPLEMFNNNASICDGDGNLLFYTNGCHIADANHNIMPNGSGINDGIFLEEFRQDTCANYPGIQDVLILPDPGNDNGYYLLHKTIEFDGDIFLDNVKYTYVDLSLNSGNGDITEKNVDILPQDELILLNYLTAISHSNEVDWWLVQPTQDDKLYIFLLSESGIILSNVENLNSNFITNSSGSGTAKFSPGGLKYAMFNPYDNLLLFDFNRENGSLSNLKTLEILNTPNDVPRFSSLEWSPDGRFIYVASVDVLYQIDTWETDLEDGLVLIDTWNGIQDPFNTIFYLMALAPDCKIYMCSTSSTNSYHVINKPNEKGPACDFVQQGIRLPFVSATATMPNFPRFRVDEDDKCDPTITSIFGDHVYYRRDMTVYPNPVRDVLTVEVPEGKEGKIVVFDMQGQLVWNDSDLDSYMNKVQIDLSGLTVGTYSIEFLPEGNKERLVYTSQVVRVE